MFFTLSTRTFTDSIHISLQTTLYFSYLVKTVSHVKRPLYLRLLVFRCCLPVYMPLTSLLTTRLFVPVGKWLAPFQEGLVLFPE